MATDSKTIELTDEDSNNSGVASSTKEAEKKETPQKGTKREQEAVVTPSKTAEEENDKPKAKRVRVKPEKVQEVKLKLIEKLAEMYGIGMVEVEISVLAANVGYKHPESDAIKDSMRLLKKAGIVEVSKGVCKLTDEGKKEHAPEVKPEANPEEVMKQYWNQLLRKLGLSRKNADGHMLLAAKQIWDQLKDGKAHSIKDATKYNMESSGFEDIPKAMQDLGLTSGIVEGKLEFTDKVFPFGRP